MAMNPAHYLIQMGLASLGFDPGPRDGWWGKFTHSAADGLYHEGPVIRSEWAIKTLQRGLRDLGYYEGAIDGDYGPLTHKALGKAVDADGAARASATSSPVVMQPTKPTLRPMTHSQVIRQGSAGKTIDTFMLHCAAVPGSWHEDKTNQDMFDAIGRMHMLPKSMGGRGWSDRGYHSITFPDGERWDARPVNRFGAGAVGYNRGVYHHLMIEARTITATREAEDYFRAETLETTKRHLEEISQRTPIKRLMGHREVAAKLCPGFNVVDAEWTDRTVS